MKKLFFLITLLALFYSCNKPANLTGRVFNVYTGEPIANIPIVVRSPVYKINFSGEESSSKLLGKTETDVNGRFALNISNKQIKKDAWITCFTYQKMNEDSIQEVYMATNDNINLFKDVELNNEANQFVEFPIAPMSRVTFSFKFMSDQIGDSVFVKLKDGVFSHRIIHGISSEKSIYKMFLPSNGHIIISVDSWKNGVLRESLDTIHVKPFEKADHLIVIEKR